MRYIVTRDADDRVMAIVKRDDGTFYSLPHIPVHSPDGFEMGYSGSGPADLALAILADHLKASKKKEHYTTAKIYTRPLERRVWRLHQDFKVKFVAKRKDTLDLSSEQIQAWIDLHDVREYDG